MVHIVNGDVLGNKIKDLEGTIIVWREMYDFGPLRSTWSNEELIKIRSAFFKEKLKIPALLFEENCYSQLNQLYNIRKDEEVILWFEHDRYDQTMLMYILVQLSLNNLSNLSMVSVNSYPGISPFYGLGQLTVEQLTELFNQRVKVCDQQVSEAVAGWRAYTSANKEDIRKWINNEPHELPFLLNTFKRHLSYFPSTQTGLNEIESLILQTIAKDPCSFRELFKTISPLVTNEGLSNLHTAAIVNELTKTERGLLKLESPVPSFDSEHQNPNLTITYFGESVLSGKANRLELIGIDWWVGGVHLQHPSNQVY